jgi:Flp pilus assembly protein TadG
VIIMGLVTTPEQAAREKEMAPQGTGKAPQQAAREKRQRGAALLEAAFTIPMLLLIAVGIFEFGRAYQVKQVLTNAAREGARYAVTPNSVEATTKGLVSRYMKNGGVPGCTDDATCTTYVSVTSGTVGTVPVWTVTVNYPFQFIVLQPISQLVAGGSGVNNSLTMSATATMRNEGS